MAASTYRERAQQKLLRLLFSSYVSRPIADDLWRRRASFHVVGVPPGPPPLSAVGAAGGNPRPTLSTVAVAHVSGPRRPESPVSRITLVRYVVALALLARGFIPTYFDADSEACAIFLRSPCPPTRVCLHRIVHQGD